MIRETITIKRALWLALKKQLIGDYGNLDFNCEALLLEDPKIHIVACADGDNVNLTITFNPLEIALDLKKSRENAKRIHEIADLGKKINVPLK
ncbi:hypothetical protein [Vulcanisaeta souniana]|uniref:Uncharacterized protein n=1 Tax=Vulcanisaeta souniana JCM 11219 TaxID=1293586 RepID=A0A830E0B3_9CREN|nr:hypothetical protein [Vulcanisaeta souniana]BDR92283.1 hypothetical protein Vsou_13760 [Vulcanisaeta souniana JCM 11219]GGI74392.1 hypothetical protein GCM10007112_08930 [Vulcanisaeta souniana JCM 11219]